MKMEHECEKCNHKQDVEIPNIRQLIRHAWFEFRFRIFMIFARQAWITGITCYSLWCIRLATWKVIEGDNRLQPHYFCDKHLHEINTKTTTEISKMGAPSKPITKEDKIDRIKNRVDSLVRRIIFVFRPSYDSICNVGYCFRNAEWSLMDEEAHRLAEVCSGHLKKCGDVVYARAIKDFE